MIGTLDPKIPDGPLADKWTNHKFSMKLVNPSNKRKFDVIVVGTGLAGASAAAAPARPVPTTITSNFRLLAGLTSFMENLWFVHLSARGPVGTFESSDPIMGRPPHPPAR